MIVGWDSKTDRFFISGLSDLEGKILTCGCGVIGKAFSKGEIPQGIDLPGGGTTSDIERLYSDLRVGLHTANAVKWRIKNA